MHNTLGNSRWSHSSSRIKSQERTFPNVLHRIINHRCAWCLLLVLIYSTCGDIQLNMRQNSVWKLLLQTQARKVRELLSRPDVNAVCTVGCTEFPSGLPTNMARSHLIIRALKGTSHTATGRNFDICLLRCNISVWECPRCVCSEGAHAQQKPTAPCQLSEESSCCLLPSHWEVLLQAECSVCVHLPPLLCDYCLICASYHIPANRNTKSQTPSELCSPAPHWRGKTPT